MTRAASAANDERRVEFGDWQTPDVLAREVLQLVSRTGPAPRTVLEPTCGEGSFLAAAADQFPEARLVGFDVSPGYVTTASARLPAARTMMQTANFFDVQWDQVLEPLAEPLLILGNPPWVTNSALGTLEAGNLPAKANFKKHSGLDAMTGKSNFDISEWMIIRLLEVVAARRFTMAMLCKSSVARRAMEHAARKGWSIEGAVRAIDARTHFAAAVDAVLLHVTGNGEPKHRMTEVRWAVHSSLHADEPVGAMGVIGGQLCSNVDAFRRTRDLEGTSGMEWRSGLKHDCSRVMELELDATTGRLTNGFGEVVELERDHVFPLLKGSDIAQRRLAARRAVIVTQRQLGEDTRLLKSRAPMLWGYLEAHRGVLDARKSSIYRDQPPFAMFGVGDYSFAGFKVAICGLYKKLVFTVVRPVDGRPVMVDDTVYFLPCATEQEAEDLSSALSSRRAQEFFQARVFWDAKRPIGKALLQSVSLEKLLCAEGLAPASLHLPPRQQTLAL